MNHQDAEKIFHDIAKIWTDCDPDLLEHYYDKAFQGEYYGKQVTYSDLNDRIRFMSENQSQRKLTLLDIIVDEKKMVVRFHYYAVDTHAGIIDEDVVAIDHFNEEHKIVRAWAFANSKLDYRTK